VLPEEMAAKAEAVGTAVPGAHPPPVALKVRADVAAMPGTEAMVGRAEMAAMSPWSMWRTQRQQGSTPGHQFTRFKAREDVGMMLVFPGKAGSENPMEKRERPERLAQMVVPAYPAQ
jgi:hypothetical protein